MNKNLLNAIFCFSFLLILILLPNVQGIRADEYSSGKSVSLSDSAPNRILPAPEIIRAKDGSFSFAVFGDSRTGEVTQEALEKVLLTDKIFDENDIVDEEDKEFVIYRNQLFNQVASNLKTETDNSRDNMFDFIMFSGDLPRQGNYNHWKEIYNFFDGKIPELNGSWARVFPTIGNHELWAGDELEKDMGVKNATEYALSEFFQAFPYLIGDTGYEETGLHYYGFYLDSSLFVNLCTGNMVFDGCIPDNGDRLFLCEQSTFSEQMNWFKEVLDYGIENKGIKNVFVQYHKPSFSSYKHPPLQSCCDPINVMSEYKTDFPYLNMYVFNGHNHTTEIYGTDDGINVMVAGGGAAPQDPSAANKDWSSVKDTPKELFWDVLKPQIDGWQKRVNYFVVNVNGNDVSIQEMVLTNKGGFFRFEEGITITPEGKIIAPDQVTGVLEESRSPALM